MVGALYPRIMLGELSGDAKVRNFTEVLNLISNTCDFLLVGRLFYLNSCAPF